MIAEGADRKAQRLITGGKVDIRFLSADVVSGFVTGDHGTYSVEITPEGRRCSPVAGGIRHMGQCSHILALDAAATMAEIEYEEETRDRTDHTARPW
jgi:hypothetical protein